VGHCDQRPVLGDRFVEDDLHALVWPGREEPAGSEDGTVRTPGVDGDEPAAAQRRQPDRHDVAVDRPVVERDPCGRRRADDAWQGGVRHGREVHRGVLDGQRERDGTRFEAGLDCRPAEVKRRREAALGTNGRLAGTRQGDVLSLRAHRNVERRPGRGCRLPGHRSPLGLDVHDAGGVRRRPPGDRPFPDGERRARRLDLAFDRSLVRRERPVEQERRLVGLAGRDGQLPGVEDGVDRAGVGVDDGLGGVDREDGPLAGSAVGSRDPQSDAVGRVVGVGRIDREVVPRVEEAVQPGRVDRDDDRVADRDLGAGRRRVQEATTGSRAGRRDQRAGRPSLAGIEPDRGPIERRPALEQPHAEGVRAGSEGRSGIAVGLPVVLYVSALGGDVAEPVGSDGSGVRRVDSLAVRVDDDRHDPVAVVVDGVEPGPVRAVVAPDLDPGLPEGTEVDREPHLVAADGVDAFLPEHEVALERDEGEARGDGLDAGLRADRANAVGHLRSVRVHLEGDRRLAVGAATAQVDDLASDRGRRVRGESLHAHEPPRDIGGDRRVDRHVFRRERGVRPGLPAPVQRDVEAEVAQVDLGGSRHVPARRVGVEEVKAVYDAGLEVVRPGELHRHGRVLSRLSREAEPAVGGHLVLVVGSGEVVYRDPLARVGRRVLGVSGVDRGRGRVDREDPLEAPGARVVVLERERRVRHEVVRPPGAEPDDRDAVFQDAPVPSRAVPQRHVRPRRRPAEGDRLATEVPALDREGDVARIRERPVERDDDGVGASGVPVLDGPRHVAREPDPLGRVARRRGRPRERHRQPDRGGDDERREGKRTPLLAHNDYSHFLPPIATPVGGDRWQETGVIIIRSLSWWGSRPPSGGSAIPELGCFGY